MSVTPQQGRRPGLRLERDGMRRTAFDLLAYPTVIAWRMLCGSGRRRRRCSAAILAQVEIDAKYAVYVERQSDGDIAAFQRDEGLCHTGRTSTTDAIEGFSNEVRQKLQSISAPDHRPGEAGSTVRLRRR